MSLPRAVLYGASTGGKAYLENSRDLYDVIAFVDRDPAKQGHDVQGIPVLAPSALLELEFDVVVIASSFLISIRDTLRNEFGIPEERIVTPPKSHLKIGGSIEPFHDDATRRFAGELLVELCGTFTAAGVDYFIDHGTLLGLVRDGDLIPWDDDIDITVPADHIEAAHDTARSLMLELDSRTGTPWRTSSFAAASSELRGFTLLFDAPGEPPLNPFGISVEAVHFVDGQAVQSITAAPERFFRTHSLVDVWGIKLRAPAAIPEYLEHLYGDWQTPQRGQHVEDIRNLIDPTW